jgi:hypothetical protein
MTDEAQVEHLTTMIWASFPEVSREDAMKGARAAIAAMQSDPIPDEVKL